MIGTYHNIALCRASCPTPMSHQLVNNHIAISIYIIYFQVKFRSKQLLFMILTLCSAHARKPALVQFRTGLGR